MVLRFSAVPYEIIGLGGAIYGQGGRRQRDHNAKGAAGGLLTRRAMQTKVKSGAALAL
jgi:hypothetical protein